MYNYVITQISPISVMKAAFCTGVCFGGLLGILLGIIEKDAVGLFGGLFLGFAGGLGLGLTGLVCAAIFNALVPKLGGIALTLEATADTAPIQPTTAVYNGNTGYHSTENTE